MAASTSVTPVIAFLDVDSFEVQIWQRDNPNTKGKPCVVANSSGRILAASYEAKAVGISRTETPNLRQARKKCDNLVIFRKPDKYGKQDQSECRKATAEIVNHIQLFLKQFGHGDDVILEVASSDEFYLNISAEVSREMELVGRKEMYNQKGFSIPSNVVWEREKQTKMGPFFYRLPLDATKNHLGMNRNIKTYSYRNEERLMFGALFLSDLCHYLEEKTGLQMSGGVAKNKLLSKIGCGLNKPKKITVFHEKACHRVSKIVDLSSIPGLGGANGEKLKATFGISKMGDILRVPYEKLEEAFGKEKSTQFVSWAMGQDVEPVERKIYKEQIRCNKPSGDIKTLDKFKKVLKDLTSEITVFLEEEKTRYGRKATELKVEYKYKILSSEDKNTLESQHFDIENPMELMKLITKEDAKLCQAVANMVLADISTSPPSTLRINAEISNNAKLPVFKHSLAGTFRITSNLQYSTQNAHIPTLLTESKLQALVGYRLMKDFSPTMSPIKLITDYNTYDELKHQCFSKWLQKNLSQFQDAKFVSFHGRILRAFKTTLNQTYGEWETYAMNVNNRIYLWDEKSARISNFGRIEGNYVGELFEQIVTGRGPTVPGAIDGMTKVLPILKVNFGAHTLLLLSNVDAQEPDSGEFVQVQTQTSDPSYKKNNKPFLLERNLKTWTQAVVSGSTKAVIGYRDLRNCVFKITTNSIEELAVDVKDKDKCLVFLNRLLEWINTHLPVHNEKLVKKFSWVPGQSKVTSSVVPEKEVEKLLIPRLYFK